MRWARAYLPCLAIFGLILGLASADPVAASPWAEVGDEGLRTDIEVLRLHGLIRGPITTWPIPWGQVSANLQSKDGTQLPIYVQRSLRRVRARLKRETRTGRLKGRVLARATNNPAIVRDFGRVARDEVDGRIHLEYMGHRFAARLGMGYQGNLGFNEGRGTFDDSYAALRLGNWLFYGGVIDSWWGAGQVSSLLLSNNARPFPRLGVMRYNPTAIDLPILRWFGPWQGDAFIGLLDDERVIDNAKLLGLRLTFNPIDELEIGGHVTVMICGDGQPCDFDTFFNAAIDEEHFATSGKSDTTMGFTARYASSLGSQAFALYGELLNQDGGIQDYYFQHGSYLFGLSLWGDLGGQGARWKLNGEFSRTRAIRNHGQFGNDITYNHHRYRTGYRYRGRVLAHSLDGDSILFSLAASLIDIRDWTYRLAYHRAEVNRDGVSRQAGTPLSTSGEFINIVEAGLSVPWRRGMLEATLRLRDDDLSTPGETAIELGAEIAWSIRF